MDMEMVMKKKEQYCVEISGNLFFPVMSNSSAYVIEMIEDLFC